MPNNGDPNCDRDTSLAFKMAPETKTILWRPTPEPNYPNPFGSGSTFKTTIPFTIPEGGVVAITVMDEAGHAVLADEQEFTGGGRHFFFFTSDQMPAGTYYYRIEFPKGNVVVNRQMVVVK